MDSLDLEQEKKALRIAMNKRRLAVTPPCAERLARIAGERLLAEQAWKKATSVGLYFSIRGELDSKELLKAAWAEGKEVLLPRSLPGRPGIMELLPCSGFEALVPGLFGIMEPDPARCPSPSEGSRIPELLVVPGLAFDRGGYRLGSGGGYYDRLLARPAMHAVLTVGYGYAFQLVSRLPRGSWDLPLHGLCTDQECLWLK